MKFDPTKTGLMVSVKEGDDEYFINIKNNKVRFKLFHVNHMHGLRAEWHMEEVIHRNDGTYKENSVFWGKIPSQEFGDELLKNLIY